MKITLQRIQQKGSVKEGILDIKSFLYRQKRKGRLFFQENIHELEVNHFFEMYFYLMPSEISSINAFPIPIQEFCIYKNTDQQYEFMYKYFQRYYMKKVNDTEFFSKYDLKNPFIGEEYIWYFKKSIK
ncbi:hypothetical protein ABEP16_13155 [Priestia aryabhattai]|uniref:hypothetical protein n=1 Tax=Priestia aryabhattai TaxID=412384 RepID=UPI003D26A233